MNNLLKLYHDESGATAIEYGFIVALIVIGIIASVQQIGLNFVRGPMTAVSNNLYSR